MLSQDKINQHLRKFAPREDIIVDILCGPTAVGKTWVSLRLTDSHEFIVPTTTRKPASDEIQGEDYYFITKEQYEKALLSGKFVTTFKIGRNYFGFQGSEFERIVSGKKTPLAIIYYKELDSFLKKFPNSRIHFMFPPFTKKGLDFLKMRMLSKTVWQFEARWRDTLQQMQAMYAAKPTLLEKYNNSKLYEITNNRSALKLIRDLKSYKN